jgi:hypothetical protein
VALVLLLPLPTSRFVVPGLATNVMCILVLYLRLAWLCDLEARALGSGRERIVEREWRWSVVVVVAALHLVEWWSG